MQQVKQKLSLNCVGGGSKGILTAGMLKRIAELNLPIEMVYGCSSGALNAALFVQNDLDILEHLWMTIDNNQVRSIDLFDLSKGNIYSYSPLIRTLRKYIKPDKLKGGLPFYVTCTSLVESASVHFSIHDPTALPMVVRGSGNWCRGSRTDHYIEILNYAQSVQTIVDPVEILVASASIPVLVNAVNGEYFDGGLTDNYNLLAAVDNGATDIICLHPGEPIARPVKGIIDATEVLFTLPEWSIYLKQKEAIQKRVAPIGLREIIGDPGSCPLFDFDFKGLDRKALFQQGYDKAKAVLG